MLSCCLLSGLYSGSSMRSIESGSRWLKQGEACTVSSGIKEPLSCSAPPMFNLMLPPGVNLGPVLGSREGKPPAEIGLGLGAETESELSK